MGTMETIRERLSGGAAPRELIDEGFSSSSVYKSQRQLRGTDGPSGRESSKRIPVTPDIRRSADELFRAAQVENDPEVVELKRELRLVKLEQQLAEAKGPGKSDGHGLLAVEIHRDTLRLFHGVMSTVHAQGMNYHPTLGEWLRDVRVAHIIDHPELVDLPPHFSREEAEAIFSTEA